MEPYTALDPIDQSQVLAYISTINTHWHLTSTLSCIPPKLIPKRDRATENDARNLKMELLRELSELATSAPGAERYVDFHADWMKYVGSRQKRKKIWKKGKNWLLWEDVAKSREKLEKEQALVEEQQGKGVGGNASQGSNKRKRDPEDATSRRSKRSRHRDDYNSVVHFDNLSIGEPLPPSHSAPGNIDFERFAEPSSHGLPLFTQRQPAAVPRPTRLPPALNARIQQMLPAAEAPTVLPATARPRLTPQPRIVRPQWAIEQQPPQADDAEDQPPPVDGTMHPRDIPGLSYSQRIVLCKIRLAQAEREAQEAEKVRKGVNAAFDWQYDLALMEALAARDGEAVDDDE